MKNITEYKEYINLPKLDLKVDYEKINDELQTFIKIGKVDIIPFELANITNIISKYFNGEKPFGKGDKKYEFPDAIVLSALEEWCKKENSSIYIISGDKDMLEYKSRKLIPIPNLREMLNKINRQYKSDRTDWINSIYTNSEIIIEEKIKEKFKENVLDNIWYDISLENLKISRIRLSEAAIVQDDPTKGETVFQMDVDITFSADIGYEDYSCGSYDKEDDIWMFGRDTNVNIEIKTTQTVEILIEAFYEDKLIVGIDEFSIICSYCSIPDSYEITDNLDGYILQL